MSAGGILGSQDLRSQGPGSQDRSEAGANAPAANAGARRAYLDHNATSPLRREARAALLAALEGVGNASSVHADGRAARARIEAARGEVARLVGASPRGVVFTSGATEAAALALHPAVEMDGRPKPCHVLLMGAVEHPAVLRGHRFPAEAVEVLPVDGTGRLDLGALEAALARHAAAGRRALLALMAANNETGVVQPVAEAARLVRAHDGVVFCDAVQAAGRLPLDMAALGVDFLSLSAHKMGGPQGAGALVAGPDDRTPALIAGGGQERSRRAGTENSPAIAGFGAVARVARADLAAEASRLATLRDGLERAVLAGVPDAEVIAFGAERLPNTSTLTFAGLRAETLVIALDLAHVSVSAGSACSSGKVGASHVLSAMGVPEDRAAGAIRLSLGWSSTRQDVDEAVAALQKVVPHLRSRAVRAA
ncbi:cysteine desulfurase family protein [Xanthobacter autotrophicus]|uniref:cysteine desulfurase family protein n=1 Tax=Xanthobacter autotrophicus TaxID=280 RepID=UPI0024A655C9|nr:cysteine desulfurase family protein [Xanthobacter autotrophicus]MDI4656287.1 cysteine desulfurase [Xanthobacter autotrophicus]